MSESTRAVRVSKRPPLHTGCPTKTTVYSKLMGRLCKRGFAQIRVEDQVAPILQSIQRSIENDRPF